MAYGGGGAAAAHAAAIAQAIKASGAIVRVTSDGFTRILAKIHEPLVVVARGGFFKKDYRYLTAYKGLVFYATSPAALMLPGDAEVVESSQIWIPG